MKKSLVLLPALLLIIFAVFSAIDRSDYVVEKKMWKIQQQFDVLAQYPGTLSEEKSADLVVMYQGLIEQYPKSGLLGQIYMKIGQVYAEQKDFEKARTNYSEVLKRIPRQKEICSLALLSIGLTYEQEKKDGLALKTYRQIVHHYPLTDVGLNMPLYIAGYYHRLNKDVEAKNAFQDAEIFYRRTVQENPGSSVSFNSLRFLAVTYLAQKKWDNAVKTFEKTLLDYCLSPYLGWKTAGETIYSINVVSIKELKNPRQPVVFYQMFIAKHPQYPLNKFIKEVIVSLQEMNSGKNFPVIRKI